MGGTVDGVKALAQWTALRTSIEAQGVQVLTMDQVEVVSCCYLRNFPKKNNSRKNNIKIIENCLQNFIIFLK
jgi:hypothetical protein